MKLTNEEWNSFIRLLRDCRDPKVAKGMFEMWLDEKMVPVYKQGWKEACEEYDITDTFDWDDDEPDWDDPHNVIYPGY